jgi:hypothetical protein
VARYDCAGKNISNTMESQNVSIIQVHISVLSENIKTNANQCKPNSCIVRCRIN